MPKLLYMLLYIAILGALEKLKPSDNKGSSSLKWWSWGPSDECSDLHNLYLRDLRVMPRTNLNVRPSSQEGDALFPDNYVLAKL